MPTDLNGIVINEILADPDREVVLNNFLSSGFDTDGDGTVRDTDEFIELFNTSITDTVDIGGWTLGDDDGASFAFPQGTEIAPEGKVVLVTQYNGTLPSGFFELDSNSPVFNNTGDTVVLSDSEGNQIAATYNGASTTISSDNFGNDTNTESLQRSPDGSDDIVSGEPTPECFLTGTRVLTESGYKLVEELKISDKVHNRHRRF